MEMLSKCKSIEIKVKHRLHNILLDTRMNRKHLARERARVIDKNFFAKEEIIISHLSKIKNSCFQPFYKT